MASFKEIKTKPEKMSLCDSKTRENMLQGISLTASDTSQPSVMLQTAISYQPEMTDILLENLSVSEKMACTTCNISFEERSTQVLHYRSDWHRFNIKQKLRGQNNITEDAFLEITGDISSISGSDTESDDDKNTINDIGEIISMEEDDQNAFDVINHGRRHPRVFFKNSEGQLLSIYRSVLYDKKHEPDSAQLISLVTEISKELKWVVLMLAGGHFAAAVFDGDTIIIHKTIHRYVVRAKRGTSQSSHDSQGGHAKSVGAFMRRHHEAALLEDIRKLLAEWSEHMKSCNRIFLRATGANRTTLFGGKNPVLDKKDQRIRLIPFPTRRPTFNEVKRVHSELTTICCHDKEDEVTRSISTRTSKRQVKTKLKSNKGSPERQRSPIDVEQDDTDNTSSDSEIELIHTEHITNTLDDLQEFECTKKSKKKRHKKKKFEAKTINIDNNSPRSDILSSSAEKEDNDSMCRAEPTVDTHQDRFHGLKNDLYTAVKIGNNETLQLLLKQLKERCDSDFPIQVTINVPVSKDGSTLLHIASTSGHKTLVRVLLETGADPTVRDNAGQLVYVITKDKEARNEFRRFRADYPEKYNYDIAQIPTPLTKDMEDEKRAKEAEKRKAQRKIKKKRNKTKKNEEQLHKTEEQDKKRFLNLSDREKRALAAERRLVSQMQKEEKPVPSFSRCFTCGVDMTAKVPFEYNDNIFCTSKCLQAHRKSVAGRT